jgi:rhodanese-related sulfurtransferase
MGLMDLEQGLAEFQKTPGAVLLDVRTPEEYAGGHLAGSRNLPLQTIMNVEDEIPEMDTPVFVYCQSGGRSRRAAAFMEKIGYTNVKNIGGVAGYSGPLEK